MDGKNSQKDVWLKYCEECVKSKIDKNAPQECNEEMRDSQDSNL